GDNYRSWQAIAGTKAFVPDVFSLKS
ncbi:hypothetical protein M2307_007984, partial [Bradyrhizobium japonicum]|nr:hypothetical protein [Bradyrhizobium japonicum]MDH6177674.1 hypothetical protein [Bradyrhizobium japonicum]MDH6178669.1 hypothetical protein [Bradyrhizobium japonicum]MDH6178998.1 hypothetical protein [Bradyrhizobium japonicum]